MGIYFGTHWVEVAIGNTLARVLLLIFGLRRPERGMQLIRSLGQFTRDAAAPLGTAAGIRFC